MDYKEKYEDALERAKEVHNEHKAQPFDVMLKVFPELAVESENERIRKDIVFYIAANHKDDGEKARWFYWLEKQGKQKGYTFKSIPRLLDMIEPSDKAKAYCQKLIDTLVKEGYNTDAKIVEEVLKGWNGEDVPMAVMDEQKPFDYENVNIQQTDFAPKVEPKFHKGEWIVLKDKCYKVNYNGCGYELVDQDGLSTSLEYGTIDKNAHIWDVTTDAKDGDVLYCKSNYGIEYIVMNKGINCDNNIDSYFRYNSMDGFDIYVTSVLSVEDDNITPATKEQRDLLFQKMKERGYEWDAENKELKEIDTYCQEHCKGYQETGRCFADGECEAKKKAETDWSEEDECYMSECIGAIATKDGWSFEEKRKTKYWLKSLKERCTWKPNDEEMKTLLRTEYEKGKADVIAEFQKSWSEEDENTIKDIIKDLEYAEKKGYVLKNNTFLKEINWLKSLISQNAWKPSDKQIHAFEQVYNWYNNDFAPSETLTSLYNDLKKLKEE